MSPNPARSSGFRRTVKRFGTSVRSVAARRSASIARSIRRCSWTGCRRVRNRRADGRSRRRSKNRSMAASDWHGRSRSLPEGRASARRPLPTTPDHPHPPPRTHVTGALESLGYTLAPVRRIRPFGLSSAHPGGPMAEVLTESFCERCGTRYTFESAKPRVKRLKGVKVLSRGLKNFVLSDDSSLDEAMAAARSDTEREVTSQQLDAFHKTFNFCMTCRQYTCANCWNEAEGTCLTCSPHLGHEIMPAPFPDLDPLGATIALESADGATGNGAAHERRQRQRARGSGLRCRRLAHERCLAEPRPDGGRAGRRSVVRRVERHRRDRRGGADGRPHGDRLGPGRHARSRSRTTSTEAVAAEPERRARHRGRDRRAEIAGRTGGRGRDRDRRCRRRRRHRSDRPHRPHRLAPSRTTRSQRPRAPRPPTCSIGSARARASMRSSTPTNASMPSRRPRSSPTPSSRRQPSRTARRSSNPSRPSTDVAPIAVDALIVAAAAGSIDAPSAADVRRTRAGRSSSSPSRKPTSKPTRSRSSRPSPSPRWSPSLRREPVAVAEPEPVVAVEPEPDRAAEAGRRRRPRRRDRSTDRCRRPAHLADRGAGRRTGAPTVVPPSRRLPRRPPRRPPRHSRNGRPTRSGPTSDRRRAAVPRPPGPADRRPRLPVGRIEPRSRRRASRRRPSGGTGRRPALRQLRAVTLRHRPVLPALRDRPGADPPARRSSSRTFTQAAP